MSWDLYLRDVLGVREVVWPASAFAAAELANADEAEFDLSQVKILFLIEPSERSLGEFDLFLKMRAAMKIAPNESLIWEISPVDLALRETEISNDWVVVSFSKKLSDYLRTQRPRLELVTTISPYEVEKDPKLKRGVWEDLKTALDKAGLSSRLQS